MFKKMKLGTKMILGFSAVAVITLLLGVVGYYGAVKSDASVQEIGIVRLPSIESLLEIKAEAENIRGTMRTLGLPGISKEMKERQYDNLGKAREKYETAWKIYEPLPQTPEEARVWQQFVPAWNSWRSENNTYVKLQQDLGQMGIPDPMALGRKLEQFTKDHYQLAQKTLHLAYMDESFDGGEDHTACHAGRWLAEFKTDNPRLASEVQAIQEPHRQFHEAVRAIKQAGSREEMQHIYLAQMVPAMQRTFTHFDAMIHMVNAAIDLSHKAEAQLFGPVTETQRQANALLHKLVEINDTVAEHEVESAHHQAALLKGITLIAAVAGVLLALVLGFVITRSITRPINRIIGSLNEGSDQVASASGQVSSSSQSLAEGASEQAASIEETSSSLEEMSSMTKQNADNATEAKNKMADARSVVAKVDKHMKEMTEAIQDITKSSEETGKIIKTIDEIAFQTNLLALNAAVEAARAGEAGAGFAVVADEVRNLAMRAAEAAKNTADLIENTIKSVKNGNELTEMTQSAFKENIEIATKVGELVDEIAAASQEQAKGIDQVNIAVGQMDKVTQQNAANAEESASAAEEMSGQAEQMKAAVGDLVKLVGGAGSGENASQKTHFSQAASASSRRTLEGSTGSNRHMTTSKTRQQATEVNPRQAIPMDEEDFKDF